MNRSQRRKAIKRVAKANGVSVEEVRDEMQKAIMHAYRKPNSEAQAVPKKGKFPTPEEFIDYCHKKVLEKKE